MTPRHAGDKPMTGTAGVIGTALSESLSSDDTVVGPDRSGSKAADDTIIFDLTSDESGEHAFQNFHDRYSDRIDSVIHLAAYFDFTGEDNPLCRKITMEAHAGDISNPKTGHHCRARCHPGCIPRLLEADALPAPSVTAQPAVK